MYVCVWVRGLDCPRVHPFCLLGPSAGSGVSGLHQGCGGVVPAARIQLYVHCVAPWHARGGHRAPVSLSAASMAQGAV